MSFAVISIICFHILKDQFKIWDTSIRENTPTYSIMNLINYKVISNFAVSEMYDFQRTANNSELRKRISESLFGNVSYQKFVSQRYSTFISMQRKFIFETFLQADNQVSRKTKLLLEKQMYVQNERYPNLIPQNMTIKSMLINLISSIYFSQNGFTARRLLLFSVYLPLFYKQYTSIIDVVTEDLSNGIQNIKRNNIILAVFANVMMLFFIVPLWKFNWQNKKEFQKIYNLFACLNVKLILRQIQKLDKIETSIFANSNRTNFYETSNKMQSFAATSNKIKEPIEHKQNREETRNYDKNNDHNDQQKQNFVNEHKDLQMIKIRKRGADLNINGSDCDKKAFLIKDWIPIIFIVAFLAIFNVLFYIKFIHIQNVENQFKITTTVINFIEDTSVALTSTKMFMDDYSIANPSYVFGIDLQQWLNNWIVSFESKSSFYLSIENEVLSCPNSPMICKKPFSLRLFEGMIKKFISNGYQSKKAFMLNSSMENMIKNIKVRLSLISGTYVLTEINKNYIQWIGGSYASLQKQQGNMDKKIDLLIKVFWIALVAYVIFCIAYITYKKYKYIGEVTLLSILNKQMIYNNKNVESFLIKISKSLR